MTCESCIKDISDSLHKLSGIQKVEANLKDQLVTIEGTGSSHFHVTRFALKQALICNPSGAIFHSCRHPIYWKRCHSQRYRWFKQ